MAQTPVAMMAKPEKSNPRGVRHFIGENSRENESRQGVFVRGKFCSEPKRQSRLNHGPWDHTLFVECLKDGSLWAFDVLEEKPPVLKVYLVE